MIIAPHTLLSPDKIFSIRPAYLTSRRIPLRRRTTSECPRWYPLISRQQQYPVPKFLAVTSPVRRRPDMRLLKMRPLEAPNSARKAEMNATDIFALSPSELSTASVYNGARLRGDPRGSAPTDATSADMS